jgi:hypothetical protein
MTSNRLLLPITKLVHGGSIEAQIKVKPDLPLCSRPIRKAPEWLDVFTVGPGEKSKLSAGRFRGE